MQQQLDHTDLDHGGAGRGQPLIVLAVAAVTVQPSQRPLHYPALGQQHESSASLRPAHDINREVGVRVQPLLQFVIVVRVISPQQFQPGEVSADRSE